MQGIWSLGPVVSEPPIHLRDILGGHEATGTKRRENMRGEAPRG